MKCANHTEKDAAAICNHCARSICPECLVTVKNTNYCKNCVSGKLSGHTTEHSPVLACILSFLIGGLGQIYNGQVGKGIAILLTSWLIIPWFIGIIDAYRVGKKIKNGTLVTQKRFGCLIAVVISIFAFWLFVIILALVSAIAIPVFMHKKMVAREHLIRTQLQTAATVLESYAAQHKGRYPTTQEELRNSGNPLFLYENETYNKYRIHVEFDTSHYRITAEPETCGIAGTKIFSLETNGVITEKNCLDEEAAQQGDARLETVVDVPVDRIP